MREQISRAKQIPRSETLQEHNRDKDKSPVPFTITYNPALPNIQEILHKKQPILYSTNHLQKIFKDVPFIAYRRSPNLRDLLVRAKLKNTNTTPKPTIKSHCIFLSLCFKIISFRGQKKLGPRQIGLLKGFNSKFPTSIPTSFVWESPLSRGEKTPAEECIPVLHSDNIKI